MDFGPFRRRTIALVAAYAMALQTLFAGLVAAAPVVQAASFAVLCSHDGDDRGQPAGHDLPCAALCAAIGQGVAGPLPPGVVAAVAAPYAIAAIVPVSEWVPPQVALTDVHAPRGPPLA